ncbi:hypothetical protein [Streptomyces sp. NPDC058401]|uniref:hypothetical protein n=1 Tax=Streptomyces sp. NPDC058401 TaxID=3346480 RepID=UPI0036621751
MSRLLSRPHLVLLLPHLPLSQPHLPPLLPHLVLLLPLPLPLLAGPACRVLAGALPPRRAVWLLTGSAAALAMTSAASLALLAARGTVLLRTGVRRRKQLRAARVLAEAGPDELFVLDEEHPDAYALPGRPGRIVVTSGMLRALSADERGPCSPVSGPTSGTGTISTWHWSSWLPAAIRPCAPYANPSATHWNAVPTNPQPGPWVTAASRPGPCWPA